MREAEKETLKRKQKAEDTGRRMKRREEEEEEKDKAQRQYMIGKLLTAPCGICGSFDHKAITEDIAGDQNTIKYECPAALQEEWDTELHHSVFRKNIAICPYKFAQMFSFQKDMIIAAFPNLKEHGCGKYDHQIRWYLFRTKILEICEEQKEYESRFKREIPTKEDDEDGN